MDSADARRERLKDLFLSVKECHRCALGETRTKTVFGAGNAGAKIMFVGEAPGYHEDQQGLPFVGQAGKLLEKLLLGIGLTRDDVFIANVLKCRPPDNRDPLADEIELCRPYLEQQIEIISPRVICTMGNFATKLLSASPAGISSVRGRAMPYPVKSEVMLFPVFHPAAALYTPSNLKTLELDFQTLAEIAGIPKIAAANEETVDTPAGNDSPGKAEASQAQPPETQPISSTRR